MRCRHGVNLLSFHRRFPIFYFLSIFVVLSANFRHVHWARSPPHTSYCLLAMFVFYWSRLRFLKRLKKIHTPLRGSKSVLLKKKNVKLFLSMSCIPVIFSLKPGAFVWIDKCHSIVFFDKYPVSALMEYLGSKSLCFYYPKSRKKEVSVLYTSVIKKGYIQLAFWLDYRPTFCFQWHFQSFLALESIFDVFSDVMFLAAQISMALKCKLEVKLDVRFRQHLQ